ncbi:MAG TPA: hypothetical protein VG347_07760 [Verrucomicrobiae bacterium]|nr:hypothetical protein [Verrucomicrobiae bacterium]
MLTQTTPTGTIITSRFPSLCWCAILGGTVAAIGIHILLTMLGVGGGLATFSSASTAAHVSSGAAFIWTLCALVALFFGGSVAGRFSHTVHSGFVHGILVWSLTLIITVLLISVGTGKILGGAVKAVGEGVKTAAGPVQQSQDQLSSFIDEASLSIPTNATPKAALRVKREVGFALTKLFVTGSETNWSNNRAAAIQALSETAQMSEADATRNVDDWINSYRNLKAELAQQADIAAANLSRAAIWSFFALLIGLLVAGWGGSWGAACAVRHAELEGVETIRR